MNPGLLDLSGTYLAPLAATPATPRRGAAGAAQPAFAQATPIHLGRLRTRAITTDVAGGPRIMADTLFLARWSQLLAEGGRLEVEGRTYEIVSIADAPGGRRRAWLHLSCKHVKGVAAAARPLVAFAQ
jgi:hypothetical protein